MPQPERSTLDPVVRPPAYNLRRLKWVVSDEPASEGFAILAPANITILERETFMNEYEKIQELAKEWEAAEGTDVEKRERGLTDPDFLMFQLMTPYLHDWNHTVDGEVVAVPKQGGDERKAFESVGNAELVFMLHAIGTGYRTGKGLGNSKMVSAHTFEQ